MRSLVQLQPDPPSRRDEGRGERAEEERSCALSPIPCPLFGAIAQLGERLPCTQEVGSSILPGSTNASGSESQALKASQKSLERFASGEAKSSLTIRLDRGRRLVR